MRCGLCYLKLQFYSKSIFWSWEIRNVLRTDRHQICEYADQKNSCLSIWCRVFFVRTFGLRRRMRKELLRVHSPRATLGLEIEPRDRSSNLFCCCVVQLAFDDEGLFSWFCECQTMSKSFPVFACCTVADLDIVRLFCSWRPHLISNAKRRKWTRMILELQYYCECVTSFGSLIIIGDSSPSWDMLFSQWSR
jgi:hypothetical protein